MDTINDNRSSPDFAGQVNRMFDRVAGHYDTLNGVMTAGLHHRWRERAADRAGLGPGESARAGEGGGGGGGGGGAGGGCVGFCFFAAPPLTSPSSCPPGSPPAAAWSAA